LPLLGTAATELAFSHIHKGARKNEYSQFIGNQVGKERNTMHIVKWFIEKIKKEYATLIGDPNLTDEQYRQWCLDLTDEEWCNEKQWKLECEEAERQYRKEQEEHMLQQEAEHLEEERKARLVEKEEVEAYFEERYPRCYDCGSRSPYCGCDE
jgi:hypothetical protein